MIVTFDRDILQAAVTPAMAAVSNKNTIAAIDGICIHAEPDGMCELHSFDMEKGIRCTLRGEVKEPGVYVLNGQKLSQMIRSMPDRICIEVSENNQAKISSGSSTFTINALPGEMFPNMPDLNGDMGLELPQCELRDAIQKTMYAVAVNEPRPALNGIYFRIKNDRLVVAATDSFRLAVCEKEMALHNIVEDTVLDSAMIVPGKAVTELYKMLSDDVAPVKIYATQKHIIFNFENICFFSRLIDAEYVQFEKFIPKNPTVFASVEVSALRDALERASLVTEDKGLGQAKSYVKFSFEDQVLRTSAVSVNGTAVDEISMEKEGSDMKIGLSCRYVLDALRVCDTKYIRIALVGPLVSAVITPDESRYTEDDLAAMEKKKKQTGVTAEKYTHLVVPLHMKE